MSIKMGSINVVIWDEYIVYWMVNMVFDMMDWNVEENFYVGLFKEDLLLWKELWFDLDLKVFIDVLVVG